MNSRTIAQLAPRLEQIAQTNTVTIHLDGEPSEIVMQTVDALAARNDPPTVFVRGGELTRFVRDERGQARLEPMSEAALRVDLERRARFVTGTGDNQHSRHVSRQVLESVRALGSWPDLPAVEAIVEAPVLRASGHVVDTPGYDPHTRLVYDPSPRLRIPGLQVRPTGATVTKAIRLLRDELLGDFPFATEADQANALALMLTPIIRTIVPLVPLAVIDAPRAGTGKGLLGSIAARIATGRPAPVFAAPSDEAEWGKALTAMLGSGSTFIFIDEAVVLRSARLASALTATDYRDRRLGRSEMITVPQRATWVAAGNNVQLAGDLPRRAYRIRLDPKMARPWTREDFRHSDLERFVDERRGDLLAALLTIVRAWFAADCPATSVPTVGGFREWAKTVAGILAHAGVDGFLANLAELYTANDGDAAEWEGFLRAIGDHLGLDTFTTSVLASGIDRSPALREVLPVDLASKLERPSFKQVLGKALRGQVDTRHGDDGIRIEQAGTDSRNGTPEWRIAVDSVSRESGSAGSQSDSSADQSSPSTQHVSDREYSRDSRDSRASREGIGGGVE